MNAVKTKKWYNRRIFILFIIALSLYIFNSLNAQLEDLEELGIEEVKCTPDSLVTIYDQFKSDSLSPQQMGIWYSLAREEFKYKNYERAIPYYWKILVNDSTGKFKVVYSKLAECYFNLNQADSVFIVCYRGLEKYADNTRLHYYAGSIHDQLGHTQCAIPHYEALVTSSPEQKSYWEKLAYLYYKQEDEKAIEAQQKVVELDPNDVPASGLLAEIQAHFGVDPLKTRKKTFLKDPSNIENAFRYGREAFESGLYRDAIQPFDTLLRRDPRNALAMEYLGRCYEGLNQLSKALSYYKDILQIDPKSINVLCLTASVYGRLSNFTTARRYVRNAQRVDPGNGLPHMIMAEIYENSVQYCSEQRKENKITYDDKLVYRFAQDELRKATKDSNYASEAKRRIKQFDALIPTKEDLFMHKNRKETNEKCYEWINQ